jgi:DNA replication protein DnaC
VHRHRADDSVGKAVAKLIRSDLVVIDDVGLLPVSTDAAEALFRVIDAAYEKRSIAISSNIHPSGFDELMPKSLATATVDRLLHHAHVLITDGSDSYRLAQATAGKGVKAPGLNTRNKRPDGGEIRGHQRGEMMAVVGEK